MYRYFILCLLLPVVTACSNVDDLGNRLAPSPELTEKKEDITPSALKIPQDFPEIIPQYANSELQEISDNLTNKQGLIRWSSSDSLEQVSNFYQGKFKGDDWEITQPFNADDNTLIAQKEGLEVKISFLYFKKRSFTRSQ